VLRECLERVPDDIDAARELLLYGLKNTQLSIVAQMTTPPGSPSSLPVHAIDSVVEVKRQPWPPSFTAHLSFSNVFHCFS